MKVKLVYERKTRRSAVYSSKDFGGLIISAYVPLGPRRLGEYTIDIPDELMNGEPR